MKTFNRTDEFNKEFKKLEKKFRSLSEDLKSLEKVLAVSPTGIGKNFTIVHDREGVKVVKARLACKTLKDRSLRVIYAHHDDGLYFMYIEIYAKNQKENEDRDRVQGYLDSLK
jgi:hypothetical protein